MPQNQFDPDSYIKSRAVKSFDPDQYLINKTGYTVATKPETIDFNTPPIDPIDSIYNVISKLEYGDRAVRHNNPGAVMFTNELAERFGAVAGDSFPDNEQFKTAYFNSPEQGEAGTRHIIKNIYDNVGGDLNRFASIYTIGKQAPETPEEQQIVDRYVSEIENEHGVSSAVRQVTERNKRRLDEQQARADTITQSDDPVKTLKNIKSTEKAIETEPPEVQEAVKQALYKDQNPYNLPSGGYIKNEGELYQRPEDFEETPREEIEILSEIEAIRPHFEKFYRENQKYWTNEESLNRQTMQDLEREGIVSGKTKNLLEDFITSAIPIGKTDPRREAELSMQANMAERFIAQGAGALTGLGVTGKAIQSPKIFEKVARGYTRAKSGIKVGSTAQEGITVGAGGLKTAKIGQTLGKMASTGATFGSFEALNVLGENLEPEEKAKRILKHTGLGVGLGATGSLSSPYARIPAEGLVGFVSGLLESGDPKEATLNGLIFMGFGLMNRKNLSGVEKDLLYKQFAENYLSIVRPQIRNLPKAQRETATKELINILRKQKASTQHRTVESLQKDLVNFNSQVSKGLSKIDKAVSRTKEANQRRSEVARISGKQAKEVEVPTTEAKPVETLKMSGEQQIQELKKLGYADEHIVQMDRDTRSDIILNQTNPQVVPAEPEQRPTKPEVVTTPKDEETESKEVAEDKEVEEATEGEREAPEETNKELKDFEGYENWIDVSDLDAVIRSVKKREIGEGDRKRSVYDVEIGLHESTGEQGGQIWTPTYNERPTISDIKSDILQELKDDKAKINQPLGITGIVTKSGVDELREDAIDKVLLGQDQKTIKAEETPDISEKVEVVTPAPKKFKDTEKPNIKKDAEGLSTIQTHPKFVKIDESKFQPREDYNQDIIDDIAENFDPARWEEPILWESPEGDYYVVSGHHRQKGVQKGGFTSAQYKVLPEGTTLEQAKDYGEIGNLARTEQTDFENANIVRRRMERGDTPIMIAQDLPGLVTKAKTDAGKKNAIKGLVNLSYVDKGGKFRQNYDSPNEFPKIVSTTKMVGSLRKKYDWMTNTHEQDIFDYLYVENGINRDFDKFQLNLMSSLDRMHSMGEKPKRLIQQLRKDVLEVPENAHDDIKAEIKDIETHIDNINRTLNDKIALGELVKSRVNGGGMSEVDALEQVKKELHDTRLEAKREMKNLIDQTKAGSKDQQAMFEEGVEYRGLHTAPTRESGVSNSGDNPTDIYPEDIYSENGARYYGDRSKHDNSSISIINSMRGKPDKKIKIYRAVPKLIDKPTINPGDWVSISRGYAVEHGKRQFGSYTILSKTVRADEIFTQGESIHEWGYDPNGDLPVVSEPSSQYGLFGGQEKIFNTTEAQRLERDELLAELKQISNEREFLAQQREAGIVNVFNYNKQLTDLQKRKIDADKKLERLNNKIQRVKTTKPDQGKLFEAVRAYHGSPHTFEQFELEAIGSGEGVQAFGWGLYFTDSKGVAKHYAEMGKNEADLILTDFTLNGVKIIHPENNKYDESAFPIDYSPHILEKKLNLSYEEANIYAGIIENFLIHEYSIKRKLAYNGLDSAKEKIKDILNQEIYNIDLFVYNYGKNDPKNIKWKKDTIAVIQKFIDDLPNLKLEIEKLPTANLYEVEINSPEKLNWMDYDKEIGMDQANQIISQAKKEVVSLNKEYSIDRRDDYLGISRFDRIPFTKEDIKDLEDAMGLSEDYKDEAGIGGTIYDLISQTFQANYNKILKLEGHSEVPTSYRDFAKQTSLFLKRAEIDGIKFLSHNATGGKGGDEYNYVVFDSKQVEIINNRMYEKSLKFDAELKNESQTAFGTKTRERIAIQRVADESASASEGAVGVYRDTKEIQSPSETLRKKGFLDLKGQYVNNTRSVAELLSIFRSPDIEIYHQVLTTEDGKILSHSAVSSGGSYFVSITDKQIASWILRAKRMGAKNLYLTHNHPSGDSKPSSDDMGMALKINSMAKTIYPELKTIHLVINHGTYTLISGEGNKASAVKIPYSAKKLHSRVKMRDGNDVVNNFYEATATHPKGLDGKLAVFILDSELGIRAVEYINKDKHFSNMDQTIMDKLRANNGRFVILAGKNLEVENKREIMVEPVLDVVSINNDGSVRSLQHHGALIHKTLYSVGDQIKEVNKYKDSNTLFEGKKSPRKKALARAHILENELGLSPQERILLKKTITGFNTLAKADDQSLKAYVSHLVKMKTGKEPIVKPKRYDKSILDIENEHKESEKHSESRLKTYFRNKKESFSVFNTNVVKSMDKALRSDFGEGGVELADRLYNSELDANVWIKPQEAKLEELSKGIPRKELARLKPIIESGGVEGMSKATKEFVEWWKSLTEDIYSKGKEYINKELGYIDNYFPLQLKEDFYNTMSPKHHLWNEVVEHAREVLEERMATGQQSLYSGVSFKEAERYVLEFLDWYKTKGTREHFLQQVFQPRGEFRHSYPLEMHRDRIFPEWAYDNDVLGVAHSYIDKSYTSIAYGKHLQKFDEKYKYEKIEELLNKIQEDGYDRRLASDMVAWVMRLNHMKEWQNKITHTAKTMTTFLLSPKTSIKNLGDIQKSVAWTSLPSVVRSLALTYLTKNQAHRQLGQDLIGSQYVFTQSLQDVGLGGKASQFWTRYVIGFQKSEKFVRKQTGLSSVMYARTLLKNWNPKSDTKRQRYILRTLKRITEFDLQTLKRIKKSGDFNRSQELRIGNVAIGASQPTSRLDRPIGWESSAMLSTATIFRSFPHKGLRFLKDFMWKEVRRHGNFRPIVSFLLSRLALGYGLEEITRWLYETDPKKEEEMAKELWNILLETGELGLIPDLIFAVKRSGWVSPTISLIFGAFWSSAIDITMAIFQGIRKSVSGEPDPTRNLRREVSKRTIKKLPGMKGVHEKIVGDPPGKGSGSRTRKTTR